MKFSPQGGRVRLEARSQAAGVRVAVIEPTSGLGLYIVQSLAVRIRATPEFEPSPDGGSVFFLDLGPAT